MKKLRKVFAIVMATVVTLGFTAFCNGVFFNFSSGSIMFNFAEDPFGFILGEIALVALASLIIGGRLYDLIISR